MAKLARGIDKNRFQPYYIVKRLAAAFFLFFVIVMIRFTVPSLLPFLGSIMNIRTAMEGLLVTSYWLGYTAFMLPSGIIVDRVGHRKILIMGVSLAVIFLAYPILIKSYESLLIAQFVAGSLSAMIYVALVSQIISSQEKSGLAVGIYQSAFFIASSISIALTPILYAINMAIPFILYSVSLLVALIPAIMIEPEAAKHGASNRFGVNVIGMGLIRLAAGFSYLGFIAWATYYSVHVLHASASSSGLYVFTSTILGSIGTIMGGIVGDRLGYVGPSIFGSGAIAISILTIYWMPFIVQELLMLMMGFMYGFYASPSLASSRSSSHIGTTSAFLNFMTQLGGTISPYLIGALLEYGFEHAYLVLGSSSLALVIAGSILLGISKASNH
jgi:MFS family permease